MNLIANLYKDSLTTKFFKGIVSPSFIFSLTSDSTQISKVKVVVPINLY
jgi:hypothetical protein